MAVSTLTSTPMSLASTTSTTANRPVSILLPPGGPSGLANRRRANKHLSLCLSDTAHLSAGPATPNLMTARIDNAPTNHYRNGPVRVLPRLFLGSEENAEDLVKLRQLSIAAIVNVAFEVDNTNQHLFQPLDALLNKPMPGAILSPSHSKASLASDASSLIHKMPQNALPTRTTTDTFAPIGYKKLPWHHKQDLTKELPQIVKTIQRAIARGHNVLVHCQCGVARSATVIIGYVMATQNMSMQEAYDYVKSQAPAVSPNMELLYQLNEFEQYLNAERFYAAAASAAATAAAAAAEEQARQPSKKQKTSKFPLGFAAVWRRKMARTTRALSIYTTSRESYRQSSRTPTASDGEGWWRSKRMSRAGNVPVCC